MNVASIRREQGITQLELAERVGLTQSGISRIESGMTNPTLATVQAIAKALGVTVGQIIGEDARTNRQVTRRRSA